MRDEYDFAHYTEMGNSLMKSCCLLPDKPAKAGSTCRLQMPPCSYLSVYDGSAALRYNTVIVNTYSNETPLV